MVACDVCGIEPMALVASGNHLVSGLVVFSPNMVCCDECANRLLSGMTIQVCIDDKVSILRMKPRTKRFAAIEFELFDPESTDAQPHDQGTTEEKSLEQEGAVKA